MSAVSKYNKVVGGLHKATIDAITNIDLQASNQYEALIISPSAFGFSGDDDDFSGKALSALGSVVDTVFAKIFLYGATIPSYGYEIVRNKGTAYASKPVFPDPITLTFLEDSYGISRRYIQTWINQVAVPYKFKVGSGDKGVTVRSRVFADKQKLAKRTVVLFLTGANNLPLYPRIVLHGVMPITTSEVELSNETSEKMLNVLTCSVDDIFVPTLV